MNPFKKLSSPTLLLLLLIAELYSLFMKKTSSINLKSLNFLLIIFSNFSIYAQGSYDWNEHNDAMDSIDWGSAFFGILILVGIVWIIYVLSEEGTGRIVDNKEEHKPSSKAYKVVRFYRPSAEEMKVPPTPQEILEWGESKVFKDITEGNKLIGEYPEEEKRKLRLDREQIKFYFKFKEFHNSFKKGTVVEYQTNTTHLAKEESIIKVGEVISKTNFTGSVYKDKVLVKFQDGSTSKIGTVLLKKRIYEIT